MAIHYLEHYYWSCYSSSLVILDSILRTTYFLILNLTHFNIKFVLRTELPRIFWSLIFTGNWSGIVVDEYTHQLFTHQGVNARLFMHSTKLKLPVPFLYAELQPSDFRFLTAHNDREFFTFNLNNPVNFNGFVLGLFRCFNLILIDGLILICQWKF